MLDEPRLQPDKVTRPIQLLAAWLVGLILIDGIFLETALRLDAGAWERSGLVVAAILNVPVFLAALFTLQTRFRAELQDDAHYERYLGKKAEDSVGLAWYADGEADTGEDDEASDAEAHDPTVAPVAIPASALAD